MASSGTLSSALLSLAPLLCRSTDVDYLIVLTLYVCVVIEGILMVWTLHCADCDRAVWWETL